MGWSIQTNNINQWDVVSSVTDSIIARFESEKDLIIWLANEEIYEAKKEAIKTLMTYPNQWTINNKRQINHTDEYTKWLSSLDEYHTYDEYHEVIDSKLEELLKEDETNETA